jgi:hypothetical protein
VADNDNDDDTSPDDIVAELEQAASDLSGVADNVESGDFSEASDLFNKVWASLQNVQTFLRGKVL